MQDPVKRLVERFELLPHPEGGYFREMHRSALSVVGRGGQTEGSTQRSAGTLIYFLLGSGDFSALHRVLGADEIWHLYAGGPLELHTIDTAGAHTRRDLTTPLENGEPATVVPAGWWQAARLAPAAQWAFCGCTVAPGFEFADFQMPPAAELIGAYPRHERLIRELTRR